jgi:hypothetical protein
MGDARLAQALAPAQRPENENFVADLEWRPQVMDRLAADKDAHVFPNPILFVDETEANSGVPAVHIAQDRIDRGSLPFDVGRAATIGLQLRGDKDACHAAGAATTE